MRLQVFIETNLEEILAEWVAFARTRDAAEGMNVSALRDHAGGMLHQIAKDLGQPQTPREQFDKSQGTADSQPQEALAGDSGTADEVTPAETHGAERARSGFTVGDMVAEFRALRATVLRLWIHRYGMHDATDLDDLMRFNEAIDQSVAESLARFARDIDHARDMFVAILSHDLRMPLQTVLLTTQLLDASSLQPTQREALQRAQRSTRRMHRMIDELLDFTRSRLGAGIGVVPRDIDLAQVVREGVEEFALAFPDQALDLSPSEAVPCRADADRIKQLLLNLLDNAVEHGDAGQPIRISVHATPDACVLDVRNHGPTIARRDMARIFDPFKRLLPGTAVVEDPRHLGIGLYIAEQIVEGHGGRLTVTSSDAEGTCFSARLPIQPPGSTP